MSLINEALKRAHQDRISRAGHGGQAGGESAGLSQPSVTSPDRAAAPADAAGDDQQSADGDCEPQAEAPDDTAAAPAGSRAVVAFSAGVLVMILLCLAMLWLQDQRVQPVAATDGRPAEEPVLLAESAEVALVAIEQELAAAASPAGPADPPVPALPNAQWPHVAIAAVADGPLGKVSAGLLDPTAMTAPATQPARPSDRFVLGGVIVVDGDWLATINGKLLRVGETIDGGTLLRIMSQAVEMECDGLRFTLRM